MQREHVPEVIPRFGIRAHFKQEQVSTASLTA
jgi:hypothetical protein